MKFIDRKEEYKKHLMTKWSQMKCPICHTEEFGLLQGYSVRTLHEDSKTLFMDKGVTTISLMCRNCGYLMDFVASELDKAIEKERKDKDGKEAR